MAATSSNKRRERDDEESSSVANQKKQKVVNDVLDVCEEKVGATELASAFALASLASMSPQQNKNDSYPESRDAENDNLVSPETRSPIYRNKRVSFSSDTKKPTSEVSRIVSFSPRTNKSLHTRVSPGFVRHPGFYPSTRMYNATPSYWMMRSQFHASQSAFRIPTTSNHVQVPITDKWICDFCNLAAFDTYEEACVHEQSCHMKCVMAARLYGPPPNLSNPPPPPLPPPIPGIWQETMQRCAKPLTCPSGESKVDLDLFDPIPSDSQSWFQGSISLAIPDSDKDWLSNANCYIRSTCVEAFTATEEDVYKSSKRGRISLHQVGIRCAFCSDRLQDQKQIAAVSFPESLAGIYESVKRWQRVHLDVCQDIPTAVKQTIEKFGTTNSWIPTTRQYWVDSASELGMVDTLEGIRFSVDPKTVECRHVAKIRVPSPVPTNNDIPIADVDTSSHGDTESTGVSGGDDIVFPEDMAMVPPYVYFLMRQVESTRFTEADRFVARSKGPVGYPGFQCRHCHGHAGLGKYFPISSKSLSTNSTSQNIHSHMLKCRKVSHYIKDQLLALKEEKNKSPRLEPGWRRIFFDKVWGRLHD